MDIPQELKDEIEKIYTDIGYTVIKTNALTKLGVDKVIAIKFKLKYPRKQNKKATNITSTA